MKEPYEVPEVAFEAGRQLKEPKEAPHVVTYADVRPRQPLVRMPPENDEATLRDWRIAKYEAGLQNSQPKPLWHWRLGMRTRTQ